MSRIIQSSVCLAVIVLLFLGNFNPVAAQLTRGFISGTVSDMSGAILPGVQVTITNKATNITRDTVSNDAGFYRFVAVEPGTYLVSFQLSGFSSRQVDSIAVGAAQEVVINQTMSVGGVSAEISVVATPGTEIAKTDATISRTISERVVQDLPLTARDRDVTRLALLAPTVTRAPASNEFSANGQRARNNNFMIDGTDNNDLSVTLSNARIVPEAVAEVQIQTASYSAEFGRSSGAQVSVITRSGTNQFHGEGWDYYRGNWMEPVSLLNKRANLTETPRYTANQFGGDAGGPIIKDRTFFFGLLEFNRRREAADARNATSTNIPTPLGYAALSTVPLGPGQTVASRQAVLSALTFLPSIHSEVRSYDNITTTNINGVPIQVGTIRLPLANPFNYVYNLGRIDHKLTNNDNLSYRYQLDKRDQPDVTSNLRFGHLWAASQTVFGQNHAISHTRNFGSRFVTETRLAYVRRNLDFPENDPKTATTIIQNFFTMGGLNNFPQGRIQNTYQLQNVSTYIAGKHSLKMGADIRNYRLLNRAAFDTKGTWTFSTLQDYLNNNALNLVQAVNDATVNAKQWSDFFFFQDDFKATRDLTLNMGLRYEYNTVPFGLFGTTDPARLAAGIPGPVKPDKNNWAPRVGFAYSPSAPSGFMRKVLGEGQSSIRGGFGMGYDVLFYNILTVNTNPNVLNQQTNQPDTLNQFPNLAPKVATIPPFNPLASFVNSPADSQNPTVNYWSLSIQRQFKTSYSLELGYTGNRSYHGVRQGQANPPILTPAQAAAVIAAGNSAVISGLQARRLHPDWGSRTTIEMAAKGQYQAGYVKFDRRFSHGLVLGANYTYSGNWSDNDESLGVTDITNSTPQIPEDFFNYRKEWGRSIFDRPHRFVVHYVYEVPWFSSGWASQSLRHVFGGWEISGWTEAQSGQPFTIRTGVDSAGIGTTTPARPDLNVNGVFKANYNSTGTIQEQSGGGLRTFFIPRDATGLVVAPRTATGALLENSMPGGGNLGRNTFRGPTYQQWNFSLMKSISITERGKLQIRSDFINLWNHNNFANPVATMASPAFGTNTADLLSDTRQILFSAKLKF
jgi:hypothetical protein